MAIRGCFYATSGTDRPYYYSDFNRIFKEIFTDGVCTRGAALGTLLQASKVAGTMKSQVAEGVAFVDGIYSEVHTAAEEVTHDAADVSNPRIDLIVLEVAPTAGVRASSIKIVKGTAAAVPSEPAITENEGTQFQYKLAAVTIPAGATASDSFTYTDKRTVSFAPVRYLAAGVAVADSGELFSASDVEAVLAEIMTAVNTKLASASYTAADVLTKIKTVDGASSGLDADLLDGNHASAFQTALAADSRRKITISSSDASGGSDGDIWFKV